MSQKLVAVALVVGLAGSATVAEVPADVQRLVERYESPDRIAWQMPSTVMRLLALEPGDRVADLGTGSGYFLPRLALSVGSTGKVYAVDIDQRMLDLIKSRPDMAAENIVTILAKPDDPMLPEDTMDVVLIVNTWHHIKDRAKYLKRLAAALNPWGRVVLIDFREGPLPVGPPPAEKLSRDAVVNEFTKGGWTLGGESVALPYQYYLVFEPPRGT